MKLVLAPTFGLDEEGSDFLREHLGARAALPPEERSNYALPERIRQSAWMAFNWQIGVFWQDRPFILILGTLALAWQAVRLLDEMVGALLGG